VFLFMPAEQSAVEYHHYYRASQKRVQQWVQKTSQELLETGPTAGRSSDLLADSEDAGHRNSSDSRRRESHGSSKIRSSSSSKLQIQNQVDDNLRSRGPSSRSRSTRKKAKTNLDVRPSRNKPYSSDGMAISSLLSFGLFPLIFVLTPPSVATLFSAVILLAGYLYMDYGKKKIKL